jgi:hypothetical protein
MRKYCGLVMLLLIGEFVLWTAGCGTGLKGTSSSGTGAVTTTVSDPAACEAPSGPFAHVYVTITDVKASTSAAGGNSASGFVDLTPQLSSAPQQVDLLGEASNQCFLASLGSNVELQAGSYQQFRVLLAPDSTASSITNNKCGSYANCVVLSDGSVHDLALSSESKTGIKIPAGQIANGQFTISPGKTEDLDINFLTCESIVQEGNGTYRLKPVLHAGEVNTTSTSINGTIISSATQKPLAGGSVLVALEQKDSTGVDRILMTTMADTSGHFAFCPVPSGTYDVVAIGVDGAGVTYSAGVETGLSPGDAAGNIPLIPSGQTATIQGIVSTQNGANPPMAAVADIQLSALQTEGTAGPEITIPTLPTPASANAGVFVTAPGNNCPSYTNCVDYSLAVPGSYANVGAYSTNGASFSVTASTSANYTMDALAFVPQSGGTPDCTMSEVQTSENSAQGKLSVSPGSTATAATLAFTGCQ